MVFVEKVDVTQLWELKRSSSTSTQTRNHNTPKDFVVNPVATLAEPGPTETNVEPSPDPFDKRLRVLEVSWL